MPAIAAVKAAQLEIIVNAAARKKGISEALFNDFVFKSGRVVIDGRTSIEDYKTIMNTIAGDIADTVAHGNSFNGAAASQWLAVKTARQDNLIEEAAQLIWGKRPESDTKPTVKQLITQFTNEPVLAVVWAVTAVLTFFALKKAVTHAKNVNPSELLKPGFDTVKQSIAKFIKS